MSLPGFTAESALAKPSAGYRAAASVSLGARSIIPQFCYCQCWLQRICIPIGNVWRCYYVSHCIPHGNCPPGYCQSG